MTRVNFILLIVVFVFLGCNNKISDAVFEQNVLDELFLTIVDSTYQDQRLYTSFPEQGKPIYDKNGKWIGLDSVGQYQRDLECEVKRAALEKDTLNLIIAIADEGFINEKTNLNKYKSPKFIFKHLSEHPRGLDLEYNDWKTAYEKFAGVLYFSHIKFDDKKESGNLDVIYSCGGKCGLGYSVYIKKIKTKWVISKVENTSIS